MDPVVAVAAVLLVAAGVTTLWLFGAYTGLKELDGLVDRSWQQVDDELRRRRELVPNLLAVVRDRTHADVAAVADATAAARAVAVAPVRRPGAKAADTRGSDARVSAERVLSEALEALLGVADGHPALRADETFLALRAEVADALSRARAARRLYNDNVSRLDARLATFPASLVARVAGVRGAPRAGSLRAEPRPDGARTKP